MLKALISNRESILSDSAITLASRFLVILTLLAVNAIVARVLGPELKGAYDMLVMITTLFTLLFSFGIETSNIYYGAKHPETLDAILGSSLIVTFVSLLICLAVGLSIVFMQPLESYLAQNHIDRFSIYIIVVSCPISMLGVLAREILRATGRILEYNLTGLLQAVVQLLVVVILVYWSNLKQTGAILAWSISQFSLTLCVIVLVLNLTQWHIRFSAVELKRSLLFGLRLYPGSVAQYLNYRLDVFLVAFFLTPYAVGIYALATMLAEKIWEIPHAIRTILLHRIAAQKELNISTQITLKVTRITAVIVLLGCIAVSILAYPLIELLFGKAYRSAALSLVVLLPGVWTLSIGKIVVSYLSGIGHPEVGTYAALTSLVITGVMDVLLIPKIGIVGAAAASSIAYTVSSALICSYFLRETNRSILDLLLPTANDITLLMKAPW